MTILRLGKTVSLMLVLMLAACGDVRFEKAESTQEGASAPSTTVVVTPGPNGYCVTENFTQPDIDFFRRLDVLFVTDTSGSLNPERAQAAAGIADFTSSLPEGMDLQVAVMLAHGNESSHTGKLYTRSNEPTVLKSTSLTIDEIKSHLMDKLTKDVPEDMATDGGEAGLYSLSRGIEATQLAATRQAHGFFRTNAALAVIFISDENDICAEFPAGVTPVVDPNGREIPAKAANCTGITPTAILQRLNAIKGLNPLYVGGVLYTDVATVPHQGENEYGYGYMDLINLAEGQAADLNDDIPAGLKTLGDLVAQKLALIHDFVLSYINLVASSIVATVDGESVIFTHDPSLNVVHMDDAGSGRSKIVIDYCIEPGEDPIPTPGSSDPPTPVPDIGV